MPEPEDILNHIQNTPASDLNDDELGIAVLIAREYIMKPFDPGVGFFEYDLDDHEDYERIGAISSEYGIEWFPEWDSRNPVEDYAMLRRTVAQWCGKKPQRLKHLMFYIGLLLGEAPEAINSFQECGINNDNLAILWMTFNITPRQLAIAFVTAARKIQEES